MEALTHNKDIAIIYGVSILMALGIATSYGLFTADIHTPNGALKTFYIFSVFTIPFIISAVISSEIRSRRIFTPFMQTWVDVIVFWIIFSFFANMIISKSPGMFSL